MTQASPATWRIGEATVTRIEELLGPAFRPNELLASFDQAVLDEHLEWMAPSFYAPATDQFIMSVHSWLIQTPHHNILVDTCCGNAKQRPGSPHFHQLATPYLDRLRCAGVEPEDIDYVLCTHLHVDHVGWNTRLLDGRWVPTFPNAKYIFSREELDFWDPANNPHLPKEPRDVFADSVLPIIAAKQHQLVSMTDQLGDNLLIEPAPGHSPGQVLLRLRGGTDEALFVGDVMHNPIQVYQPTWNSRVCLDPELAVKTRLRVLNQAAEHNSLLFPAHFGVPHAGRIRTRGDGFAFAPEEARRSAHS
ncbi:MBL fold metallo-hydrolase [Rhizobium sp. NBRC 114257]|uniref:MBL fold metallo-hydrolase n=1 Tax=Rhizobium dioscoreae TaxID=2653122 RepID=A0ABQ0ZDJ9_9HYPH|nr:MULTISPECIES: MBL fold metallo-hydrolase [Rhizobium]GES53583.1 MBL fold metallo-hydrolase [Rhizobium dioscoreae]GLU85038.1 MBL fold metallo-hydrolase [Rhizobium sp. NBRC 114257]